MSSTKVSSDDATNNAGVGKVNMKLEVVAIPVSNVDRSKEFYAGPSLQWRPLPQMHLDVAPLLGMSHDALRTKLFVVLGYEF